uniref:Uncharacterized protein n=1 Tax=Rhizophora mucronata TaxID=61149 RepID=A0A2P2PQR5_RHIMU
MIKNFSQEIDHYHKGIQFTKQQMKSVAYHFPL